jgi:hypothetical protein
VTRRAATVLVALCWMLWRVVARSEVAGLAAPAALRAGASETTPARSQYFTWINNTNEGPTEDQTAINLAFFRWLHDEFGMTLDIYAFDAGLVDGKGFTGTLQNSGRFMSRFPHGLAPVVREASAMGTRLGHWGGPDGFGATPEDEAARIAMIAGLCRDYHWALLKLDSVCGELRPEKESAFIRLMQECRRYCPDLIVLNHRLPLGEEGLSYTTTRLWDGEETYIDVHMGNRTTAPHHRAGALSRGNTPGFSRLYEDHGVCISSCPDNFDDDLVLQTFGRNLILAPEIYGNPWLLRDDEFPKLARIFNLARRHREILVHAQPLPEDRYGPGAVSRGDGETRMLTLRNLTWEPATYRLTAGEEIGLKHADRVDWRQFHPGERVLGSCAFGATMNVTVPPFRSCLLLATTKPCAEVGVTGCDFEVERDAGGKPILVRLLGQPGSETKIALLPGAHRFASAALDGRDASPLLAGGAVAVRFDGRSSAAPWHRKLATLSPAALPADAEALYEATCFAADNNALEARSLARSGGTTYPAVQAARDAFFQQRVFVGRGLWDRYLFDGDPFTTFYPSRRGTRDPRVTEDAPLRVDFGEILRPEVVELIVPDQYSLQPLVEDEGGLSAEVSADLKQWTSIPFIHGETNRIGVPDGLAVRYVRMPRFSCRVAEVNAYGGGKRLDRGKWRASNLFGTFGAMKFTRAWSGTVRVDEAAPRSFLCVALNGKQGVEGAYAAVRLAGGSYAGAPDRAPSYPCNPWEGHSCRRDSNYTYYIPVSQDMLGRDMDVVVLGGANCAGDLRPEVWLTAPSAPMSAMRLELTAREEGNSDEGQHL